MSRRSDEEIYEGTTPEETPTGEDIVESIFDFFTTLVLLAVFLIKIPLNIYRWWKNRA